MQDLPIESFEASLGTLISQALHNTLMPTRTSLFGASNQP
jgi:hypothetical protein